MLSDTVRIVSDERLLRCFAVLEAHTRNRLSRPDNG